MGKKLNVKNVYLIDDCAIGYEGKINELHKEGKYKDINLILPPPFAGRKSINDFLAEILENVLHDEGACAVLLDNYLPFFTGKSTWLHDIISKNQKIQDRLKKIAKKKVKIIIFTSQQRKEQKEKLINSITSLNISFEELLKTNPDDEEWIENLSTLLEI